MLPPAHRLRRSADFSAVVRGGRRAGRRHLVVHLLSPAELETAGAPAVSTSGTETDERSRGTAPALVGFVVSKAVGGSVVRNRVERRLRHLVREQLDRLPEGSRAVVRANPPAAAAGSAELRRDLTSALDRLGARR